MQDIACPICKKNVLHFTTAETKSGQIKVVKIQCVEPGIIGDLHKAGINFFNDNSACRFPIDSMLFSFLVEMYLRIEKYQKDKEEVKKKAEKIMNEELFKLMEENDKRMEELEDFITEEVRKRSVR